MVRSNLTSHFLIALVLTALLFLTAGRLPQAAPTAVYYLLVDTVDDTYTDYTCTTLANDCSLRGAIRNANAKPADAETHIIIPSGDFSIEIDGSGEDSDATGDLDVVQRKVFITGNGMGSTRLVGHTDDRVLENQGGTLTIEDLTITKGNLPAGDDGGGGIINRENSILNLDHVTVDANYVNGTGQMVDNGGGIANYGTLTIVYSIFSNNSACNGGGIVSNSAHITTKGALITHNVARIVPTCGDGGGIAIINGSELLHLFYAIIQQNSASRGGGLYYSSNTMGRIFDSTIRDNTAVSDGGGLYNDGELFLKRDTISGNQAKTFGGGAYNNNSLNLLNVTIADNYSDAYGGGLYNNDTGGVSLIHVTIAENTAAFDAYAYGAEAGSHTSIQNSILASSSYGNTCHLVGTEVLTDLGYNLSSDQSCKLSTTMHDMIDTSPALGSLAANGGLTYTMSALWGSPVIDHGNPALVLDSDQRLYYRPIDGDHDGTAVADIGAFEYESIPWHFFYLPAILR